MLRDSAMRSDSGHLARCIRPGTALESCFVTPERFAKLKTRLSRRQADLTVLAENVHKTHNIAAILRTADAVGIYGIHAVSETGEFRHHHMVSGGSRKWVDVTLHDSTAAAVRALKDDGFRIITAHPGEDAHDYRDEDYTARTALLMGAELTGVSTPALEFADAAVVIPMEGMVSSLNVSVAAALILYEARRQREAAGMYDERRLADDVFEKTLFEWAYPDLADRLRRKSLPYPPLTEDGDLAENPLTGLST